jgi:hypothetical protein
MPKSQSFLTSGLVNNKVDIIWVIDNSGTMGPKQTNLANSISSFTSQFVTKQLDYKIAVVTTDIRPVDPAHPTDPNYSGQHSCFVQSGSYPKVITPSTPNAAAALAANAQVGYYGAADAHGIDAARLALSSPNSDVGGCNEGFLRSDAFLAVIQFSDADDDTTATPASLLSYLDTVKKPFSLPSGGSMRSYFIGAMVVQDLSTAACQALGPFSEVGTKFLSLANTTGGPIASICDSNFSAGLLAVSTKILEDTTAVHLASKPDVSTILVFEDSTMITQDAGNGWTYDSAGNRIVFHGNAIPAGSGVTLTVNYTPADIVR